MRGYNPALRVDQFVEYFTGLGRPVAAAFIFPAAQTACSGTGGVRDGQPLPICTPGFCSDPLCTEGAGQA